MNMNMIKYLISLIVGIFVGALFSYKKGFINGRLKQKDNHE